MDQVTQRPKLTLVPPPTVVTVTCVVEKLIGHALDWAVAKALGTYNLDVPPNEMVWKSSGGGVSTWHVGYTCFVDGEDSIRSLPYFVLSRHVLPLIEAERIQVEPDYGREGFIGWCAHMPSREDDCASLGPTLALAALRCFVKSKLGKEVDVPKAVFDLGESPSHKGA